MERHLLPQYERHYMKYIQNRHIPLCLQSLKIWAYDIKDYVIEKPVIEENSMTFRDRIHAVLRETNSFAYANKCPRYQLKWYQTSS